MIEVEITEEMKKRAWRESAKMGKLKGSITQGKGNIAGFLGEQIANSIIGGELSNTYEYDLIKDGKTYDIKTKRCTSKPLESYECSITNTKKQSCDYYVFVRVENINGKWGKGYFLGLMKPKEYFKLATLRKKGERDGGFVFKADCWNLPISSLKKFVNKDKKNEKN